MLNDMIAKFTQDNEKTLAKVEKIIESSCESITHAKKLMLGLNVNNIVFVKELQKDITAHYIILEEWYQKVASLKKNKELAYFMLLKKQSEEKGEKFVSAPSEKEAALFVAFERKLRDKILGSLNGATEILKTCRNLINSQKFESQTGYSQEGADADV